MKTDKNGSDTQRGFSALFFHNRHLLALSIILLVLAGLSALSNLPRIEDPRITTRNALVITGFPGASAERVETLVTEKLEDRLEELEEIKEIQSTSRAGISLISLELVDEADAGNNEEMFSKVRDKLADAQVALPPGASKSEFDDQRGAVAFTLVLALTWERPGNDRQLGLIGRLAEELADDLRNVSGTERVRIYGEPNEEITVTVDSQELAAQNLSAATLAGLIRRADPKGAAGALRAERHDLFVEVAGELDSAARIRSLALKQGENGRVVRVGDVAQVERHWQQPPAEIALVDGARTVLVAADVQPNVRVDEWMRSAKELLSTYEQELDDGVGLDIVFDQSRYTTDRLAGLSNNALAGALVVMAIVVVAMGWRAALIVGLALPLSAFAAIFGLTLFGQQIHQMSIFGLIIAIGLLIDNAIVVTDEIQKQLAAGRSRAGAVQGAVSHLAVPLLASTLTTILGFMPIFLLPGNVGDFVGPIAISVVLALAASFVISMSIIAALAARYLGKEETGAGRQWWHAGIQLPALNELSTSLLRRALKRPLMTAAAATVLPILGFGLAGTLGLVFFPPADRDQFEVELWMPHDASISRTASTVRRVEETLREHEGIKQVSWLVGSSHPTLYYNRIMKQDNNPAYAHAMVLADSNERASDLVAVLQAALDARHPGAQIVVSPLAQGPPVDAPVGFRIVGPSLDTLAALGAELRRIMYTVPEITHTRASLTSRAQLSYAADQTEVELAGLSLDELTLQLQGNLEGLTGGSVLEDLEELPVRIRYAQEERGSLPSIASMKLISPNTPVWVPANSLGEMELEPQRASITRRDGERVNVIYGYVKRGALPIEVTGHILQRLDEEGFTVPAGYRLIQEGDSESQREAVGKLATYVPVLVMLMVASIVLSFRSGLLAAIVGFVAVLSAGLGMLSLWLGGYDLGFNPLIGSAGLIGVAINGTIVVLAALRANPAARLGDLDAVVRITLREARHVLATTATTIGGFVPLLVFTGGDFWPPLAVVIAGGVGFSVSLSLVFTPAVYRLACKWLEHGAGQALPTVQEVPA